MQPLFFGCASAELPTLFPSLALPLPVLYPFHYTSAVSAVSPASPASAVSAVSLVSSALCLLLPGFCPTPHCIEIEIPRRNACGGFSVCYRITNDGCRSARPLRGLPRRAGSSCKIGRTLRASRCLSAFRRSFPIYGRRNSPHRFRATGAFPRGSRSGEQ